MAVGRSSRTDNEAMDHKRPVGNGCEHSDAGEQIQDDLEDEDLATFRQRSRSHEEHRPPRPRNWSIEGSRPRAVTSIGIPENRNSMAGAHRTPGQTPPPSPASRDMVQRADSCGGDGITLRYILNDRHYCAAFEVWLKSNHAAENLAFYYALQAFKESHAERPQQLNALKKVKKQFKRDAQQIYDTFIDPSSSSQVNLSYPEVKAIKEVLSRRTPEVEPDIFGVCEKQVVKVLEFDILPRFKQSNEFNLQQAMANMREDHTQFSNTKLAKFFGRRKESVCEAHTQLLKDS